MANVGIVIVSHSPKIAEGAADMVRQMVGDGVNLAYTGGDPGGGLRVTLLTTDSVRTGTSGTQGTQTIQMRDANGSLEVVSVDISKSDNVHALQLQIAPSEKPK